MNLDDKLQIMLQQKRLNLLVVDDACDFHLRNRAIYDPTHMYNEENIINALGNRDINCSITDMGITRALSESLPKFDHVFYKVNMTPPINLAKELEHIDRLGQIGQVHCILDSDHIAPILASQLKMFNILDYDIADLDNFPTLMHYLSYKLTGRLVYDMDLFGTSTPRPAQSLRGRQHSYKNKMWKENYVKYIDTSLLEDNSQRPLDYTFFILSDREIDLLGDNEIPEHKVFVKPSDYQMTEQDLKNCAAIFIDNDWNNGISALGKGIEVLSRVRQSIHDIPIIYVTAHEVATFTDDEIRRIENLGGILASKDTFPKVTKDIKKAKKELQVYKWMDEEIRRHVIEISYVGGLSSNFHVICSRQPDVELEHFPRTIKTDTYETRMYVLSMFHQKLKAHIDECQSDVPYFRSFDFLSKRATIKEDYRQIYDIITQRKDLNEITCVAHNDAKWDNWFSRGIFAGSILGDFGDVGPGNEYKDIARALFDKDTLFTRIIQLDWVKENALKYLEFRPELKVDKDRFVENVYCMIFTEALREATKRDYATSKGLMGVVDAYGIYLNFVLTSCAV